MFPARIESKCVHRMDRLYLVAVAVGLVGLVGTGLGCDEGGSDAEAESKSSSSRVNAVQADESEEGDPPEAFCDKYFDGSDAQTFEYPELRDEPPASADGWKWVNVWATWCKPCIEEMPRLVEWREELDEEGLRELVLISVDESREKIETFREKHPETPSSLLITEPKAVKPWVESLGLSPQAPLPVHVFVDPEDRIRCLRAGGVGKDEYESVERLIVGS